MDIISHMNWRYATKKFDPNRKVSSEDLETIKEAVRLSASSFGLQPYKVIVVEDQDFKEKLQPAVWGQDQIVSGSHVFVFCNYAYLEEEHIEELFDLKAEATGQDKSVFEGYASFIKGTVAKMPREQHAGWNASQAYIALGTLLTTCAGMRIDACPMEGFDPAAVGELLGLEAKGLQAAVIATIGYRSEEDPTQHAPKVRRAKEDLFETI